MYRDVVQWSRIRHRVLIDGISQQQIARESGISPKTIRKMLAHPQPVPYGGEAMLTPKQVSAMVQLHELGWGTRRIAAELGCSRTTAKRYIKAGGWVAYGKPRRKCKLDGLESWLAERYCRHHGDCDLVRQDLAHEHGVVVSLRTVERAKHWENGVWRQVYDLVRLMRKSHGIDFLRLLAHADPPLIPPPGTKQFFRKAVRTIHLIQKPIAKEGARQVAFEWMRAVLQNDIDFAALRRKTGDPPDFPALLHRLYTGRLAERNRAMVVLASCYGIASGAICAFLGITRKTCHKYQLQFAGGGAAALFSRKMPSTRKVDSEALKAAVFRVLHEPPSKHGINRTTWTMPLLARVLKDIGQPACPDVIRKITRAAGYRWRKARVVLTSSDPNYSEKLDRVRSILSGLQPDEAFFSIDEFGPFAVKMRGGRALTGPDEQRIVPQWQKSRGCLIVTAALELSGNQVTHFYSAKKNTAEMIKMMEILVDRYRDRRKLYLSWDAASWHISKRLYQRIEEHNAAVIGLGGPAVETAPLPSGAQFLNVIESVFSGMARAIIHNSDYATLDDARAAIDRYFEERNVQFKEHPRRAGKKIWRKEREPAAFSDANNCKDPRYR
jgi:transposase